MKRLWTAFALVMILSFVVLGWIGTRIYQAMPPLPARVVTTDGTVLVDQGEIQAGQNVWQSLGGMEVGSVWGTGAMWPPTGPPTGCTGRRSSSYGRWSKADFGTEYDQLDREKQAQLQGRLTTAMRTNTYDPVTHTVNVSPIRAEAFQANLKHYSDVFANGRAEYAIPAAAVSDPDRLRKLSAFFFWTSWSASTNRLNEEITFTHNWPYEPLVGNRPTGETVVWTGVSIIMLLAGISAMVWWYAARKSEEERSPLPEADPLGSWVATPSQKATIKYFWVVSALILVQMLLGVVTAHYGVEGDGFYGIPLSDWLPYSVTRTWHIRWDCSGLRRRGWRRDCSSAHWSANTNRRGSASA